MINNPDWDNCVNIIHFDPQKKYPFWPVVLKSTRLSNNHTSKIPCRWWMTSSEWYKLTVRNGHLLCHFLLDHWCINNYPGLRRHGQPAKLKVNQYNALVCIIWKKSIQFQTTMAPQVYSNLFIFRFTLFILFHVYFF